MDTAINGFHHVKLPVADLARSRDWYARVLGRAAGSSPGMRAGYSLACTTRTASRCACTCRPRRNQKENNELRAQAVIMSRGGATGVGELRHHGTIGAGALYIIGLWESEDRVRPPGRLPEHSPPGERWPPGER